MLKVGNKIILNWENVGSLVNKICDTIIKDRCVTHDKNNLFYRDDDHPSLKGAEMINDLIMKEIEKIELKSN